MEGGKKVEKKVERREGVMPRFGVLTIQQHDRTAYVIFDRQTARITDGVYAVLNLALDVAAYNEALGAVAQAGMTPHAEALGLRFPGRQPQARARRTSA
jgi:hypothetical protein